MTKYDIIKVTNRRLSLSLCYTVLFDLEFLFLGRVSLTKLTHLAKLGEINGKTRVLYSELGEFTGKTRVLPGTASLPLNVSKPAYYTCAIFYMYV